MDKFLPLGPGTMRGMDTLVVKQRRRSKKDKDGRNYICACGKSYLSYPALYTHIKNKHGGSIPDGTKVHVAKKSTRGRPKKSAINYQQKPPNSQTGFEAPDPLKIADLYFADSFVTKEDLRLIEDLKCTGETHPSQGFQVFEKGFRANTHPFVKIMNSIMDKSNPPEILEHSRSVDTIITLYLFYIAKNVNLKFYLVLCVLFRHLRACLNEHGYEQIAEGKRKYKVKDETVSAGDHFSQEESNGFGGASGQPSGGKKDIFCEKENCDYIPFIAEFFLSDYLPKACPDFNFDLSVKIFHEFCKWLTKKNLTKIKVSYNN